MSGTADTNDFTTALNKTWTFGERWEVAIAQVHIPHEHSHFADTFKSLSSTNANVALLRVYYDTPGTGAVKNY